jgi:ribose transport system substrate-binding protein
MKDYKWMWGLTVLFLVLLFLLGNFVSAYLKIHRIVQGVPGPSTGTKAERHHIVMISQELDNPYWRKIESAVAQEADFYNMEIEYIGPFRFNPAEQAKLLEKTIAAKVDGIFVQGVKGKEYAALIDKAVSRGIPVLTMDSDVPDSKRLTYVGTDNLAAGKRLGELVVESAAGAETEIGLIIGGSDALSQQQRMEGFIDAIRNYPNLRVVQTGVSNISRIQAVQTAESMLREKKSIRVMVGFSSLDAVGIAQAVKTLGQSDSVKVFGFDDLDETRIAVANGEIEATVIQEPSEMGRRLVEDLHAYFVGTTPPILDLTGFRVMDPDQAAGRMP